MEYHVDCQGGALAFKRRQAPGLVPLAATREKVLMPAKIRQELDKVEEVPRDLTFSIAGHIRPVFGEGCHGGKGPIKYMHDRQKAMGNRQ